MAAGPEYLELGAGTKLRRIGTPETGGLCRQFGFTVTEAQLFLSNLGVPVLQTPNGDWFNEYALELALFVALHPKMPNFRARSGDGGFSVLPRMDLQRIKSRDRALLLEFGYACMLNGALTVERLKAHLGRVGREVIKMYGSRGYLEGTDWPKTTKETTDG